MYDLLGHAQVLIARRRRKSLSDGIGQITMNVFDVIKKPLVTEKGVPKKTASGPCVSKWRCKRQ